MDRQKLRGRIVERYGRHDSFAAEVLHISTSSLSAKMRGKSEWKESEIAKTAAALDLDPAEIYAIFFAEEVAKFSSKKGE